MDNTVMEFLNKGKSFRASKSSGRVVVLETDSVARICVSKWAKKLGRHVNITSSLNDASVALKESSAIVLVGWDGLPDFEAHAFLKEVNDGSPSSVIVVYTTNAGIAHALQESMPRITTIVKGEGADALLDIIEHEVPQRRSAV